MDIKIINNSNPKPKINSDELGFGINFTDHMFTMDYNQTDGWFNPQIIPYGKIELDPSAMVFHYGQETFEGLKAYKDDKGVIRLFRPLDNFKRLQKSNERMCMAQVDEHDALEALEALIKLDSDWIPTDPGTSLYIRPFVIATDEFLGVRPSDTYKFLIILSPVGLYYKEGLNPTRIYVEDQLVRAVKGGTGFTKAGGNYAASLMSQQIAKSKGYSQVLYLDAKEHKYVEEIGTSNAFFKIDGVVYTSPLTGSILPGITRDSIIKILKDKGYTVKEDLLSIEEVYEAQKAGTLEEVFATGTAAIISPVGVLGWKGTDITINENKIGNVTQMLYDELTGIQTGSIEDKFGWVHVVK